MAKKAKRSSSKRRKRRKASKIYYALYNYRTLRYERIYQSENIVRFFSMHYKLPLHIVSIKKMEEVIIRRRYEKV